MQRDWKKQICILDSSELRSQRASRQISKIITLHVTCPKPTYRYPSAPPDVRYWKAMVNHSEMDQHSNWNALSLMKAILQLSLISMSAEGETKSSFDSSTHGPHRGYRRVSAAMRERLLRLCHNCNTQPTILQIFDLLVFFIHKYPMINVQVLSG